MIIAALTPSLALLLLAQTAAPAQTPPTHDTTSIVRDSVARISRDTTSLAHIALDFGTGPGTPFSATSIELSLSTVPPAPKTPPAAAVQLRFLRAPDTLTANIASRVGTTARIPSAEAVLPARGTTPGMIVRLYDVQVASMRLLTNDDNVGLLQQRLGLQESIAQLSIDLQEAQRQLAVTESLDKRKLSSSLEVAHAHATTDALASRLAMQQQHLALVEHLLAQWTPVREEIVLVGSRVEMQTR